MLRRCAHGVQMFPSLLTAAVMAGRYESADDAIAGAEGAWAAGKGRL
jgi:hypothetical protein